MASLLCLSPFLELKQLEDRLYHIPPLFLQSEGKSLTLLLPPDTTEFFLFLIVKLLKQLSGLTVSYSSLLTFFLEPTSARPQPSWLHQKGWYQGHPGLPYFRRYLDLPAAFDTADHLFLLEIPFSLAPSTPAALRFSPLSLQVFSAHSLSFPWPLNIGVSSSSIFGSLLFSYLHSLTSQVISSSLMTLKTIYMLMTPKFISSAQNILSWILDSISQLFIG